MTDRTRELIDRLEREHSLSEAEYAELIINRDAEAAKLLAEKAAALDFVRFVTSDEAKAVFEKYYFDTNVGN